jgi:hypothetical protein
MKKATLVSLLALMALATGVARAYAQAVRINVDSCSVLAPDCSTFVTVPDMVMLQANNPDGTWTVRCTSNLPEGTTPPRRAVRCNNANTQDTVSGGILCGGLFGSTDDWQEVITPSGRVILVCHGATASDPTP